MKRFLYVFFVATFTMFVTSSAVSQVRFGARAGLNMAKVDYRIYPGLSPKAIPTFHAGALAELPLPVDVLFINVGLEMQGKGYRHVIDSAKYKLSTSVNPLYVQVPVSLIIRGNNGGMYGGLGAYFSYGVAGKINVVQDTFQTGKKITTNESIPYGTGSQDYFRPIDYGITLELGYETEGGIRITGMYSWGLGDRRRDPRKDANIISPVRHRVASIGMAYFFNTVRR